MLRHALTAAILLIAGSGCVVMPGPARNRLYVHEWKDNREYPIKLRRDWKYDGEHWEKHEWVDGDAKSKEAADKSWRAFRDDPDWNEARTASEKNGKLVEKVESVYLNPTDYSPIK